MPSEGEKRLGEDGEPDLASRHFEVKGQKKPDRMITQAHKHPRCNVHVDGVDQCGDEAVAKETIQNADIALDVWYCEDHLHLADDAEPV